MDTISFQKLRVEKFSPLKELVDSTPGYYYKRIGGAVYSQGHGRREMKKIRNRIRAKFYGSPVCVNGRLYCISRSGEVFVVAAADKFELLARVPLGEPSYATPAVADGVMYLRTHSRLFSLGGKKAAK